MSCSREDPQRYKGIADRPGVSSLIPTVRKNTGRYVDERNRSEATPRRRYNSEWFTEPKHTVVIHGRALIISPREEALRHKTTGPSNAVCLCDSVKYRVRQNLFRFFQRVLTRETVHPLANANVREELLDWSWGYLNRIGILARSQNVLMEITTRRSIHQLVHLNESELAGWSPL